MPPFLDLSDKDIEELEVKLNYDSLGCTVETNLGPLATIKHAISCDDPENIEDFTVLLCNLGAVSEADTKKVVLSPSATQLGYCFPIAAIKSGEGIAAGWPAKFAEAGFRALMTLQNIDRYSVIRSANDLRNLEPDIDDLFSDENVLMVFSKQALRSENISSACLELSLLEQRIKLAQPFGQTQRPGDLAVEDQNINLRVPRSLETDEIEIFCKLLNQADNDNSDVGGFMTYYQLIEFCIDKVFQREIRLLPTVIMSTWDLKQRLNDLTSEVARIGMLDQFYLQKPVRRQRFVELKSECVSLLGSAGEAQEKDVPWYKALYLVRNMVVHNQMRFHRQAGSMELSALNRVLRSACVEALFTFSAPAQNQAEAEAALVVPA